MLSLLLIFFGDTNINGIVGNGRLAVGISQKGEITVIKYPNPSFHDQIDLKTTSRKEKNFGQKNYMGARGGIIEKTIEEIKVDEDSQNFIDFRDFEHKQKYISLHVLQNEFEGKVGEDKISGRISFLVSSQYDALLIKYEIKASDKYKFIHFQNLAPKTYKVPANPLYDIFDDRNDFAAFIDEKRNVAIAFAPESESPEDFKNKYMETLKKIKEGEKVEDIASRTKGVFIGVGFLSGEGKIKIKSGKNCGNGRERFEGKGFVLCDAMIFLEDEIKNENTVFFAFAETLQELIKVIDTIKEKRNEIIENETEKYWKNIVEKAKIPENLSEKEKAFCERTLISIFQSQAKETGAIVASISTQPPYGEDWVRDGAYINLLLDILGFPEEVSRHNIFYAKHQRKVDEPGKPAGSFDMSFYADGITGGPIPFEIDEVGFALWTFWTHLLFEEKKMGYAEKIYPAVKLSAELLINCKENGLQCKANEDDNLQQTQTLIGASTVYMGLKSALKFAKFMKDKEMEKKIYDRLKELEKAIKENFRREEGYYVLGKDWKESYGYESVSYLIWPAGFFDENPEDKKIQYEKLFEEAKKYFQDTISEAIYIPKMALALIKYKNEFGKEKDIDKFIKFMVEEVPTETLHVSEVWIKENGKWIHPVATPHIWEASLICLSSIFNKNPQIMELIDKEEIIKQNYESCSCKTFPLSILAVWIILAIQIRKNKNKKKKQKQ